MNWGLKACVLIRLDARLTQQVSVADLAEHLAVPDHVIRDELQVLADSDQLDVTRDAAGVITHGCVDPTRHKGRVR